MGGAKGLIVPLISRFEHNCQVKGARKGGEILAEARAQWQGEEEREGDKQKDPCQVGPSVCFTC